MISLKKLLGELLQSVQEEEVQERVQKEVVEDDESEAEGVLDLFPGVILHFEEGMRVGETIGVYAEDEVEVEESCSGHEFGHIDIGPSWWTRWWPIDVVISSLGQ
ncbi:unnamed protein product [Linum trigynum]|uniref:Uncharacterized protein n=1 Tax=Linum trigynum TaxID=586398 RepID=A0AAV2FDM5_9ROSI